MIFLDGIFNMWSATLLLIALGTVSFTHYAYRWSNPKSQNGKLPPGSMGFPLIGETIQFLIPSYSLDTPPFIKKRVARYGSLFKTNLAGQKMVITTDPEISNYVFMEEGKSVHLWYLSAFDNILGNAINPTATVYVHKFCKTIFVSQVGTESLKDKLLPKIESMANQALHSWSTQPSIEVKEFTSTMIIELALRELLGYDSTKSTNSLLVKMLSEFIKGIISIPLNIPGTTFHRCMQNQKKVMQLIKDILHERQNSTEKPRGDFVDELIDAMGRDECMTEDLAAGLMIGIVFGSFETVSTSIRIAMMFLTDQQEVVKELLEEHLTIINSRENINSPLTWQEYKSMTFTSQVINETLRMTNSVPGVPRKAVKDVHINGYVIPKDWIIMVVPIAMHMNPEKFEDPLSFNPWRWNDIGSNILGKSFIPFGGGKRNCVGSEFTKVLMSVFFHVLVTKYSWTKVKGGQAVRWPGLSVKGGFHIKVSQKIEQ